MTDTAQWLEGIGLGQYAELFAEHAIGLDILADITDAELKELGLPLGDRKRLLKAIEALGSQPALTSGAAPSPRDLGRPTAVERRQITVMFCDLVGSTELSGRLDPEDFREIIRSFQETCAGAVRDHGGYVAKHLGDGLLAYFGYPQAQEDDAERAVRSGLAVARAVADLAAAEALEARVGIETGLVVVGDMTGEGVAQVGEISGDAPNLAARLQSIASPGTVAVGPTIRRVLGGTFAFKDLEPQTLKGIAEPVHAAQVVGEVRAESRFEARQAGRLTALVERDAELDMLVRRWQEAKEGEGQVVLISGEPGIGKSRLTQELREKIAGEPHTRLRYQCSPHHTNSALYPIIAQFTFAAGIEPADTTEDKLDKLERMINQGGNGHPLVAPLFADLLSIPTEDRYPPLNLTPQRQRDETAKAVLDQLVGFAGRQPVLIVFEDVHWIDPTTQELLDLIIERIVDLPVIMLVTFRPEYEPPWLGTAQVTPLALSRLSKRLSTQITANVALTRALPEAVVEDIVTKTEGVPLFVEELTKAVLEAGPCTPEATNVLALQIPATLKDSLAARLDRLGAAREVAQTGAVIGRTFSRELLAEVSESTPESLDNALDRLVGAELLFQRSATPPDATYTFKHALIQDAAYESLLKSKRRSLHARVAEALGAKWPDTANTEPELVAHHCTEAGLAQQAAAHWHKAGRQALERSANLEAVGHLRKGLEVLMTLPESAERDRKELALQTSLGPALTTTRGYATPEVGEAYRRARELCEQVGETEELFPVLFGLWIYRAARGELNVALSDAEQLVRLAEGASETSYLIEAHLALGVSYFFVGELQTSRDHISEVVRLYDPGRHAPLALGYGGLDPGAAALSFSAWTLWLLGHVEQAVAHADQLGALVRRLDHTHTVARSLHWDAMLRQFVGDWRAVRSRAEDAVAMATEHGLALAAAATNIMLGWSQIHEGENAEGAALIRQGVDAYRATGASFHLPYFLIPLAEAARAQGQSDKGLEVLSDALGLVERTGERYMEAELHRLRGELLLERSPSDHGPAEDAFQTALSVARAQTAKSLELRAAMSLARLRQSQGKTMEARDLLAPVYDWFTEGFDTADLKEAKALLGELS